MKMQAPKAMAKPFDVNIMTILRPICKGWTYFLYSFIHERQIVESIKPTLRHNCAHVCTRIFYQENFPYQDAITHWKDEKVHVETTM
jgi:hypothetical protein